MPRGCHKRLTPSKATVAFGPKGRGVQLVKSMTLNRGGRRVPDDEAARQTAPTAIVKLTMRALCSAQREALEERELVAETRPPAGACGYQVA